MLRSSDDPRRPLPRLHLLTDTRLQTRFSHGALAHLGAAAGADAVQIREKHWRDPAHAEADLRAVMQAVAGRRTQVLVNDRPAYAHLVGAHGVHVGQEDAPAAEARRLLGPNAWVGVTVHLAEELARIDPTVVDYVGIGPVFGTSSKPLSLPPLGLKGLEHLCNLSPVPVIAIGSITLPQVPEVLAVGAYGVAVLSAFACAPNPQAAAAALQQAVDACPALPRYA